MNISEIVNWFLFALPLAAAWVVYLAYRRTDDILKPARKTAVAFTPDQFRLAYETVDFTTSDRLRLRGWFIPAPGGESARTIIMCHAWGSNRGDMLRDTHFLAGKGYNLFYFDFRGCGESKGVLSSIGYLETRDFDAAYEFLKLNRPLAAEQVGVMGVSMGAAVAVYAAAKYPEISCVLAENAFLSFKNVVANWSWHRLKTPYFPLVALVLFFVRRRLKADPEPYSPRHNAGALRAPVLFVNGENDDLVPPEDAAELLRLCGSTAKSAWTVPGASHNKCAEVGGELYRGRVAAFFAERLPEPSAAPAAAAGGAPEK